MGYNATTRHSSRLTIPIVLVVICLLVFSLVTVHTLRLKPEFQEGSCQPPMVRPRLSTHELTWNRTFRGTRLDYGYFVVECSSAGVTVAGITYTFGAGSADIWLLRIQPDETTTNRDHPVSTLYSSSSSQ